MKDIPIPEPSDFATILEIEPVNFQPHPFMVGTAHVTYASDRCGGILDERALRSRHCYWKDCKLDYEQHTHELAAPVELTRDCSEKELADWLTSLKPWAEENKIDGFMFPPNQFSCTREDGTVLLKRK